MAKLVNPILTGGKGSPETMTQYSYTANTSGFGNSQTFSHTASHDCTLVFTYFCQTGNNNNITLSCGSSGFQWKFNRTVYGGNDYSHAFAIIPNVKSGSKVSISYKRTGGDMGNGNKQLYAWYELY